MSASDWINAFQEELWERGYVLQRVQYTWEQGKAYYSLKWSPMCEVPWSRYKTNQVWGPNPEVILEKLESLPYQRPDVT